MSQKLHRDYPHLLFRKHWELSVTAQRLIGQCEAYVKAITNTPILPHHYSKLMHVALMKGAQATTAIEGNTLSDEEIQRIMENKKLPPSKEYQEIEVRNILMAFNELLSELLNNQVDHFITEDFLLRLHRMVGQNLNDHFAAIPGRFRNNDVVVGRYRCPDYRDVSQLVENLCLWLRQEFRYGLGDQSFSDVVIQAIVTHLYIEWIHPFGDGNGRTGRLVEFYILLRGGNPDIASHILSNYYNLTRTEYYRQIEKATEKRTLSDFIEYALLGFRDGLVQTLEIIQQSQFQSTWQKLIYDKFDAIRQNSRTDTFKRQRTLALELPLNTEFSASKVFTMNVRLARIYSNVVEKTVQRDIDKLVELELVKRAPSGYVANIDSLRSMIAKQRPAAMDK